MKNLSAVLIAAAFMLLAAAPAAAADPALDHTGRVLMSVQGDVSIPAGEHVDVLIVVNGTAHIDGAVKTVVAIDGAVTLSGATVESIFAIRSPVQVGQGATVLHRVDAIDSPVQLVGDGQIVGGTRDLAEMLASMTLFLGAAAVLLWIGFALVAIAAALALAGLAARQVRTSEHIVSTEPLKALGAAVLGLILPLVIVVVLFATIVGAPLAIALLIGIWPLAGFVGYLVTGIWIGDWILRRTSPGVVRERPYAAAVIGMVVLEVIGIIPLLGFLAALFGYGAVLLLAWRTLRGQATGTTGAVPTPIAVAG